MLIVMTCPRDAEGNYYSRELAQEQTLRNLRAFSDKLAKAWGFMQQARADKKPERKRSKKR